MDCGSLRLRAFGFTLTMYSLRDYDKWSRIASVSTHIARLLLRRSGPGMRCWKSGAGPAFLRCWLAKRVPEEFTLSIRKRSFTSHESWPLRTARGAYGIYPNRLAQSAITGTHELIVSDLRGSLPLFGRAITSLEDARQRLLARRDPNPSARHTESSSDRSERLLFTIVAPGRIQFRTLTSPCTSLALNGYDGNQFDAEQLLTGPQTWGVLDYSTGARACAAADLNSRNADWHGSRRVPVV